MQEEKTALRVIQEYKQSANKKVLHKIMRSRKHSTELTLVTTRLLPQP